MRRRAIGSLAGLVRREEGTATIEFVILFPIFIYVMVASIEASVLMARATFLDRGLDLAVRELRLNTDAPPTFDAFKAEVCEMAAFLGPSCTDVLQIELRPVSTDDWATIEEDVRCIDRSEPIAPLTEANPDHYRSGVGGSLMMIRVCLVVDLIAPNYALGALLPKDASGGVRLVSLSAFVQEPLSTDRTS